MKTYILRLACQLCLIAATLLISPGVMAQTAIWSQSFSGGAPAQGETRSVVRMSNGDYVAVSTIGPTVATQDLRVTRHDSGGNILWTRDINNGGGDSNNNITTDSSGNIYLALRASIAGVSALNWYVVKLDGSSGNVLWTYTYNGVADSTGNDECFDVGVTSDGHVFAVGNAEGGVRARAVKINGSTGAEIWAYMQADNTTVRSFNIAGCDALGNCYALGVYPNASLSNGIYLVKFSSTGTVVFDIKWFGPAGLFTSGTDIAFDSSHQPIVCGSYRPSGTTQDLLLIKFNSTSGAETWSNIISGTAASATDTLATLKLDGSDNIYVAGFVRDTVSATTDRVAYAARHSNTDGSRVWSFQKNGTGTPGLNTADRFLSLQLSGGFVYLGGTISNTTTDLLGSKLDAATGAEQWSFSYEPTAGSTEGNSFLRTMMAVSGSTSVVLAATTTPSGGSNGSGLLVNVNSVSTSAPTVTTATQSAVTHNSATLGGNVTADGGATVTDRGIVWGTSTGPTTASNKVQIGSGTGVFSSTVNGLPSNTLVYVRAYATNSVNTSYGSEISFTTLPAPVAVSSLSTAANSPTNASSVSWALSFASAVTGITASNFSLTNGVATGSTIGTPTTSDNITWTIPVTTGSTDGTITLNLANASGLTPAISSTLPYAGSSVTIDKTPPTVLSVVRQTPTGQNTSAASVTFRVTYSEPVTLDPPQASHFSILPVNGGTVTGTISSVTGTGNTRDVTVNITGGTGEFRLRVVD